jgi:hypothetical protein
MSEKIDAGSQKRRPPREFARSAERPTRPVKSMDPVQTTLLRSLAFSSAPSEL